MNRPRNIMKKPTARRIQVNTALASWAALNISAAL